MEVKYLDLLDFEEEARVHIAHFDSEEEAKQFFDDNQYEIVRVKE